MGSRSRRKGRAVNGILLINKPYGSSSNHVLQRIKRFYGAAKAGHTGSLDPLATGMLPICFGEATKFSQYLLNADKRYRVVAKLGEMTTTGDAEGEVVKKEPLGSIDRKEIDRVINSFIGEIEQVPPMYSALKHEGKPLYKLARKGIEIERKARHIMIYSLEWKQVSAERLEMLVFCSKGTYIRTLVEDIGDALGCGAHVESLHRIKAGPFEGEMLSMQQIEDAAESENAQEKLDKFLLPASAGLAEFPELSLSTFEAKVFVQGQVASVKKNEYGIDSGTLAQVWKDRHAPTECFLGVGTCLDDKRVAPKRLIQLDGF